MTQYEVSLTYPRTTRQPVYCVIVEAETKAAAVLAATEQARREGWRGAPIKQAASIYTHHPKPTLSELIKP